MGLLGRQVHLRPLSRADLDEVEAWTPYTDPLFLAWNRFPWHRLGKDLWFDLQSTDPSTERYAVVDLRGRVIGVVALVSVDGGLSLLLSIFLGSDFVGRGLGTDALLTLLRYAFQECGIACVRLSVAGTNGRARRAYEKCGFRVTGKRYRPVGEEEPPAFLDEVHHRGLGPCLRQEDGRLYLLFYEMEIRAQDWLAADRNLPLSDT